MPALPVVPKVIRVDLASQFGANVRIRDRFFLQYTGALSAADLLTVLGNIKASWATNMSPQLSNIYALLSTTGTDLSSATAAQSVNNAASQGAVVGQPAPAGAAMVIKFKLARRYRGGHPRFYLLGNAAAGVTNGNQWTAAFIAQLNTSWAAFIAGCIAAPPAAVGTLAHVNVSYFQGFHNVTLPSGRSRSFPTQRAVPLIDPVIGYSINPNVASQRRRNSQSA